jgi:hypothetical protein
MFRLSVWPNQHTCKTRVRTCQDNCPVLILKLYMVISCTEGYAGPLVSRTTASAQNPWPLCQLINTGKY